MLKAVSFELLLICLLLLRTCVCATTDNGFPRCNCDDESSLWTIETILECQRIGDFLIAVAYFSIPIELLYFVSCSNFPFKWVLFQFIAFIVLCGMTHLLNGWTYGPHTFQLMVALTVFKILTALVSCATTITLLTLIPMLLKVKVRELMLKKKTWDLGREVGIIMKQKEAAMHVRMLTQEIRKSLDRHKILYTTLVELSKTLGLQNCAVWMPNVEKTEMNLTHELNGRNVNCSIPITNPDVVRIKGSDEVNIIDSDSILATASSGVYGGAGPVAAIRMPMLQVCNFKGGTPELRQTCYAILVLTLPSAEPRSWGAQELEIIKVVADQVAVALSHASILEESQLMREKLEEQNRALQMEKMNTMMASQARASFQKVTSNGMRRPMHSILGLLSMMQDDNLKSEQKLIVNSMLRTSTVLSNLINDAMDYSTRDDGRFPLEMKPFGLHAMVKEAACLAKCIFEIGINNGDPELESSVPSGQLAGTDRTSDKVEERLSFSICKRIIQLMQGNIWLVPNAQGFPQVMALFLRFQLWRSIAVSNSEPGENSETSNSNSFFRGLQVLLADNDDVNRAVTQKLLQKLGCVVTSVSSGFECLNVIGPAGSSFQVILLDLHMPELDGFEVATRIPKFRSRNWPVIVALTASTDDLWERCMQIGMNGVIRKPVLLHGIASELRRIILQGNSVM
uniref:Response regulatory domain-containing protein n=1 Tax=Glycine max TaxID=3847 RepID=A0A368UG86_SOYBN